MRERDQGGFTLVELMMVVLIIGALIAIVVPIYVDSRTKAQRRACYSNERIVEVAYRDYEAARSDDSSETIGNWTQLMGAVVPNGVAKEPACPTDGEYSWDLATEWVNCSTHGHYPE